MEGKTYVSVEFPGYINNIDKALETLSPLSKQTRIGEVSFIEMNFRPQEASSHPIFGESVKTTNLLLTVRKRKQIIQNEEEISQSDFSFSIDGIVDTSFRFLGLFLIILLYLCIFFVIC